LCFISLYPTNGTPIVIPAESPIYTDQNVARSSYGLSSFTIDPILVEIAQSITEQCKWADNSWKSSAEATYASRTGVTSAKIGSNSAASSVGFTSISGWKKQKDNWNCQANTCSSGSCGAWTQMVWKDSVRIGCALSTCTTGSPLGGSFTTWEYLLCLYNPAGNMFINGVKQHPFGTEISRCSGSVPPTQPPVPQPSTQPPVVPQPSTQPPVVPQPSTQPPVVPQPSTTGATPIPIPVTSSIYTLQNQARGDYGIQSFTIDQNLVEIAQGITQQCKWTDSSWRSSAQSTYAQKLGVTTTSLGINKGAASLDFTSIDLWLAGRSKWNCEANTCSSGSCGSWTQIIWKDSVRIGCALSKCTTGSPLGGSFTTWEYLLCLYNPAGNVFSNGVKQHPFGTEIEKCNLPLPALALSEDPIQSASAAISDETAQHHEVSSHSADTQLSVGALVGIIVGSILGAAVIVVAAFQLRAKKTDSEITPN